MPESVISLGAGVQSSAMLLMAAAGELDRFGRPELAVFADTGDEPAAVYEWLEFLEREVAGKIEIIRTARPSQNGGLGGDVIAHAEGRLPSVPTPPLYVRGEDGKQAIIGRSCTRDYKVAVVKRALRARGFGPKRPADQWMGISLDEVQRMKRLKDGWQTLVYPLIEQGLSRHDCLLWMQRQGYPTPPRSACTFCPYHSNAHWRWMQEHTPEDFAAAVEFDLRIRTLPSVRSEVFVHRSLQPLGEVDFSDPMEGQGSLFDLLDECEGMCGV